ncbi:MAG TPA: protein-methionine-sulfoxide reductase heme-binding subunit MsrQ [Burkholderiales bacterium]
MLLPARLTSKQGTVLKALLFILSLGPVTVLVAEAFLGDLGANPVETLTRATGTWTLVFLCITLGITPVRRLTGRNWLSLYRRMFGLFAFFYVCLHFTTYIWFDQWFDVQSIIKDVIKRPFITVGFAAFLLLIPLAATSNSYMTRKLGGRCWQHLHRLTYLICMLGVVHYWWLVKRDLTQPIIYGSVVGAFLLARLLWRKAKPKVRPMATARRPA